MKKLYIAPSIKVVLFTTEEAIQAGSPLMSVDKSDANQITTSDAILSREDNNSFDLWNDEE